MKNATMVTIDLSGHGVDCSVEVSAQLFFELLHAIPTLIDRTGIEESNRLYSEMLEQIKSQYQEMSSTRLETPDREAHLYKCKCQFVAAIGACLYGITLQLSGDGIADYMTQVGGINVTEQVEAGLIPAGQFK